MKTTSLKKGIVHEIIIPSKEIFIQSKEVIAQLKKFTTRLKEVVAQSKEVVAQSKEVVAQSKEIVAQSREIIAQSRESKTKSKFIKKISNDFNNEVSLGVACQFIALKAHLVRIKMHQEQIETAILIKWGTLEQLPLSSRYTNWLTEHGYHWQPIFANAANEEIQYEFKIFASDYEAFALLSRLQNECRLYYAIPDFHTALQIINTIKDSFETPHG
jgi:hypothetical protein